MQGYFFTPPIYTISRILNTHTPVIHAIACTIYQHHPHYPDTLHPHHPYHPDHLYPHYPHYRDTLHRHHPSYPYCQYPQHAQWRSPPTQRAPPCPQCPALPCRLRHRGSFIQIRWHSAESRTTQFAVRRHHYHDCRLPPHACGTLR